MEYLAVALLAALPAKPPLLSGAMAGLTPASIRRLRSIVAPRFPLSFRVSAARRANLAQRGVDFVRCCPEASRAAQPRTVFAANEQN